MSSRALFRKEILQILVGLLALDIDGLSIFDSIISRAGEDHKCIDYVDHLDYLEGELLYF